LETVHTISALQSALKKKQRIAFVPTMGNLHEGHLALVNKAKNNADCVVVSIFVNPLQFLPSEDFNQYPRSLTADCELLHDLGTNIVFAPDNKTLFPIEQEVKVHLPPVADILEGKFRPGFFHGVATIVLKLFNIIQPDIAVFGKKDYQQLHMIRLMVQQFNFPIRILDEEIVRAPDGLALSSRNQYLNKSHRSEAKNLYQTLKNTVSEIKKGQKKFSLLEEKTINTLSKRGWQVDYVSIHNQRTLLPAQANDPELVILAAAKIGNTRLIDNVEFYNK